MAARYDFTGQRAATRAATLQREFIWLDENDDPVNVTGMTGEMHVRPHAGSDTLILDLDTEITCGTTDGRITINVPAVTMTVGSDTAEVTYVYDLFLIDGSIRNCILSGDFEIVPNITEF